MFRLRGARTHLYRHRARIAVDLVMQKLRGRGERTGAHGAERDERRVIAAETHIERGWERSPSPARACDLSHTPHKHDRKPERTTRAGREVARTRDARGGAKRAKATETRASPYQPSSCVKHGDESHQVGGRPSVWYERTVEALVRRGCSAKKWRRGRRRADNRPWRRAPQPRCGTVQQIPGPGEDGRWERGSGVCCTVWRTPVAPGTAAAMMRRRLKLHGFDVTYCLNSLVSVTPMCQAIIAFQA